MNQDLAAYYNDRSKEYDKVYLIEKEQEDLRKATKIFQELFFQKTVLEIACGTGYWTKQISEIATSVFATDINESVIEIAKDRNIAPNVTFEIADMYNLTTDMKFDGLFGGFIWSHILIQDLDSLISRLKTFIKPNGVVVFIDSKQVKGGSHDIKRITQIDEQGNTFQTRRLNNGTTHLVLKNFPTKEFIIQKLSGFATEINFTDLEHYWIVSCKLN